MIMVAKALVLLVEGYLALVSGYLLLLVGASFLHRRKGPPRAPAKRRFAILVPAHNEELLLGRLLESLAALRYPRHLYSVHVVADNCDDTTADVARRYGATVHERQEASLRGKGHALRWLLDRLPLDTYDAAVFVDADSIVSGNLLDVANARLAEGHRAIQVYDGVLNPEESWVTELRALAFGLHNMVRPLGRATLGASAGLMGNGMVLSAELLREERWDSFGLAEDMETHLKMVASGQKVHFEPAVAVLSDMPATLSGSSGQNLRWESGRLELVSRYATRLLTAGLRQRNWTKLNAGLELFIPPQSIQALGAAGSLAASILLSSLLLTGLGAGILLAQVIYVFGGAVRLGIPLVPLRALLFAPAYVLWKGWLYLRIIGGRSCEEWLRTPRKALGGSAERPRTG